MCCLIYCSSNLATILKVYLLYCIRFSRPIEQTFIFALHKLVYLLPLFNLRYKQEKWIETLFCFLPRALGQMTLELTTQRHYYEWVGYLAKKMI